MKIVVSLIVSLFSFAELSLACTPPTDSTRNTAIGNASSACASACSSFGSQCLSYRIDARPFPLTSSNISNPTIQVDLSCVLVRVNPGGPGTIESVPFVSGYGTCMSQLSFPEMLSLVRPVTNNACYGSSGIKSGSQIDVSFQSLGEEIPLVGVPFSLVYSTDLVRSRVGLYKANIPITQSTYSPSATQFTIKILNESQLEIVNQNYFPAAGITYSLNWNGNKANGSESFDPVLYTYKVYEQGGTGNNYSAIYPIKLGTFRSIMVGLGHFLPEMYSYYDEDTNTIYYARGGQRSMPIIPTAVGGLYNLAEPDGSTVNEYYQNGKLKRIRAGINGQTLYEFFYDGSGYLASIQDSFGKTTTFNRNSGGVWQSIATPYGKSIAIDIDGDGRLTKVTQPSSAYYEMTYHGSSDLLATFRKPNAAISTFTYDTEGNLIQDSHSGGFVQALVSTVNTPFEKTVTYSQSGKSAVETHTNYPAAKKRVVTDTTAPTQEVLYGANSNQLKIGNHTRQVTYTNHPQFSYAATVSSETEYIQATYSNSIGFSNWSNPFSVSSWTKNKTVNGQTTVSNYSPTLGKWTTTTPLGNTSSVTLDTYQRVTQIQNGNLNPINLNYTNEHLTGISQGSRTTNLSYSTSNGLLESITDPLNQTTRYFYDSNEKVSSIERPDLNTVYYSYNSVGQLASITPVGRPSHTFNFNASELVSSYNPPVVAGISAPQTTFTYDFGKIKTINRPDGKTVTFNYDSTSGQLTSVASNEATVNFALDTNTNLPSYINSTQRLGLRYTYQGRFLINEQTEEANSTSVAHTYYRNLQASTGRVDYDYVIDKSNQSGWVLYSYDNDERLSQVGEIYLNYYTPDGLLDTAKSGTSQNQISKYVYNNYGEVLTQTTTISGTQIHKMTLTYDGAGRIKTKKEDMSGVSTPSYDYTYDILGRVTEVKDGTTTIAQYSYDNNGNRLVSVDGTGTLSYTYDDQDRLIDAGVFTYTYNQHGERQSKTNTLTNEVTYYSYDSFGNLVTVQMPNGDLISYEIDALNRRVGKKKNGVLQSRYIYMDGLRIAAELNGSMQLKRRFGYATKSNIPDYYVEAGVKYRIVSDQIGSPRVVFNINTGAIIAEMNHNEFGKIVANTNSTLKLPFGFAGGLYDEDTGLLRFGARDYDPTIGRWTSKDPIGFAGGDTNLYAYVGGNPMSYIDPSGLFGMFAGYNVQVSTFGGTANTGGMVYLGDDKKGTGIGWAASAAASYVSVGASIGKGWQGGFYANTVESLLGANSLDLNTPIGGFSIFFGNNGSYEGISFGGPSLGLSLGFTPADNSYSINKGLSFIPKTGGPACAK